jgi:hemerythrin
MRAWRIPGKENEGMEPHASERIERITWNPVFSVRVEELDAQHRELFAIMNRLADLYESGSQELYPVLERLVAYAMEHFHAESMVMLKFAYPAFREHSSEHAQFVEKVREFLDDYRRHDLQLSYRILIYIRVWLLAHTQQVDMRYVPFIK